MEISDILLKIEKIEEEIKNIKNFISDINYFGNKKLNYDQENEELVKLLYSDLWPNAVNSESIVDTNKEEDKQERADNILDLVSNSYSGLSVLSYGCHEGHIVKSLKERGARKAVGFEPKIQKGILNWNDLEQSFLLTDDWSKVVKASPFDLIILYDVLDHYSGNPVDILKKIKSIMSPRGIVFCRCHPWCSRHGTHLYSKGLNKAFAHIVFLEDELKKMNYNCDYTKRILKPRSVYKNWFKFSGFTIKNTEEDNYPIELFFKENSLINKRIKNRFEGIVDDFPQFQLETSFIDYTLGISN